MYSETANETAEVLAARCLLCNVGCPVRITKAGPDRYIPDYVPHAGYAGLCGRGSVLAEWLDHPGRLLEAERRIQGERQRLTLEAALGEAAEALRGDPSAAILIDGNLDLDSIAAVQQWAADRGTRWAVHVPPSDEGLVRGLDGGGCEFIGPEQLTEADALLIIGNVYATHPVAAHWIFDARTKHPRMPVLVMADASGVTAEFATGVFQPRLAVGETARAVAAVRTGQAVGMGPEAGALAGWKGSLRTGKSIAIVVVAELGCADAQALGGEVAKLAAELAAKVCPLTTYGGAWGAVRQAASGGATAVEKILTGPPRTLVVIGADVESALGRRAAGSALDKVQRLIYIGPMPNLTSGRASLVLPAAFVFETPGRALLGPGRDVRFAALLPPPAGVPTVRDVLAALGGSRETVADVSRAVAAAAEADGAESRQISSEGLLLAPVGSPIDFADGSLTRTASWPQVVQRQPILVMAEGDARAAGLSDKACAILEGPGGSVEVEVVTSAAQRPGQARVGAAFAEVRNMFGWTWDGTRPGDPVRVRVRKA